jgi:predicted nucleic acid-binding protein
MMSAYFDSAIIVKLYVREVNSAEAVSLVQRSGTDILFSQLHENEVRNAIRLKRRREELSDAEVETAFRRIQEDLAEGRLSRPHPDWAQAWTKADELSAHHAHHVNCRTLDTLHVALAMILGFREFASFDERQRSLATAAGLRVRP